ncbi:hypothetical protein DPX16_21565 [Anabarilius grahami]|uniref:Uncharacterized protein n=1 Tax=Anabarilius grahami TaxID=495550 RepID=A0A3N0XH34_ANAGA|nr:hypothetical protein DPX16_21565 [Anabarilius grahami]
MIPGRTFLQLCRCPLLPPPSRSVSELLGDIDEPSVQCMSPPAVPVMGVRTRSFLTLVSSCTACSATLSPKIITTNQQQVISLPFGDSQERLSGSGRQDTNESDLWDQRLCRCPLLPPPSRSVSELLGDIDEPSVQCMSPPAVPVMGVRTRSFLTLVSSCTACSATLSPKIITTNQQQVISLPFGDSQERLSGSGRQDTNESDLWDQRIAVQAPQFKRQRRERVNAIIPSSSLLQNEHEDYLQWMIPTSKYSDTACRNGLSRK